MIFNASRFIYTSCYRIRNFKSVGRYVQRWLRLLLWLVLFLIVFFLFVLFVCILIPFRNAPNEMPRDENMADNDSQYPLHENVFRGDVRRVSALLRTHDVAQKDVHGKSFPTKGTSIFPRIRCQYPVAFKQRTWQLSLHGDKTVI